MNYRTHLAAAILTVLACTPLLAIAWSVPGATAPNGNVEAPLNVGTTDQVKNGSIGVGGLAVFGNTLLQASSYLNWGTTAGSGGYGIRDNAGIVEVKNSGGAWTSVRNTVLNLVSGVSSWASGPSNSLHYAGGYVGIGTASPVATLDVNGYVHLTPQTTAPAACSSANKGTIAVSSYLSKICICNGTSWVFNYSGAACTWTGSTGDTGFGSPGEYTFTVPAYENSLTVEVWGGGGGASGGDYYHNYSKGDDGGWSWFDDVGASPGIGGIAASHQGPYWMIYIPSDPGDGGWGEGGWTNTWGGSGSGASGGQAPVGEYDNGNGWWPGGGGSGGGDAGGGGAGGYATRTYEPGELFPGQQISVGVGWGGNGASAGCCTGGSGQSGWVVIWWD